MTTLTVILAITSALFFVIGVASLVIIRHLIDILEDRSDKLARFQAALQDSLGVIRNEPDYLRTKTEREAVRNLEASLTDLY